MKKLLLLACLSSALYSMQETQSNEFIRSLVDGDLIVQDQYILLTSSPHKYNLDECCNALKSRGIAISDTHIAINSDDEYVQSFGDFFACADIDLVETVLEGTPSTEREKFVHAMIESIRPEIEKNALEQKKDVNEILSGHLMRVAHNRAQLAQALLKKNPQELQTALKRELHINQFSQYE